MQLDELLDLLGAPITDRKPLASGFDPWVVPTGYEDYHRRLYADQLAKHGVVKTCVICGVEWRVHPVNAAKALTCSKSCRMKRYRQRRKRGEKMRQVTYWHSSPNGRKYLATKESA